jgi:hypothetical protein
MATAISVANFEAAMGEAYDSLVSDDLTAARKWLALAEIQLAGIVESAGADGSTLKYRSSLEAAQKALDEVEARSSTRRFEIHPRWVP